MAQGCPYSACPPPVEPRPAYDELSQEVAGSVLSVRVAKGAGRIKTVRGAGSGDEAPSLLADCEDELGNKCRPGCAKVHVIPNKAPPAKQPEEELFLLRASRKIVNPEEMRNCLEIELRTPRNYEPLPAPLRPAVAATAVEPAKSEERVKSKKQAKHKKQK